MPFDSPDLNLGNELLKDVGVGKIRLPDFQRDWKGTVNLTGAQPNRGVRIG